MRTYIQSVIKLPICLLTIPLWLFSTSSTAQVNNKRAVNTLSFGGGISFGMLGISYDRKIADRVELRLASGIPFFWGGGWPYNVGIRYYFRNNSLWNPRVSLNYGTVILENFDGNSHGSDPYNNYSVGLGQTFVFKRSHRMAYTVDMDFVISEFPDEYFIDLDSAPQVNNTNRRERPLRLAIGFGVRY